MRFEGPAPASSSDEDARTQTSWQGRNTLSTALRTESAPRVAGPVNRPLGLVWVDCPDLLLSVSLKRALEADGARVHKGTLPPVENPCAIIHYADDRDDVALGLRMIRTSTPEVAVVVLGASADLRLARAALRAGACGFVHAGMSPGQIVRALSFARRGEVVLPRELLEDLVDEERPPDLSTLGPRKLEILELVTEGLTNAEIARRLFLSESTVKQHLRGAYKLLGVKNRNQAAGMLLRGRRYEAGSKSPRA